MNIRLLLAFILAAMLVLSACGSDDSLIGGGGDDDSTDVDDGNDNGEDNGEDNGGDGSSLMGLMIGSGSGDDFNEGELELQMSTIAAGGSTGVLGTIVDEDGELADGEYQVTFHSDCMEDGLAEINSPVSALNGEFSTTYTATGCSGSDTIQARVEIPSEGTSETIIATADVEIEPAELGSITFESAEPRTIGLQGMGNMGIPEASEVQYQVSDVTGAPIPGQQVEFSLSTSVGGIELSTDSTTTDNQGIARVTVTSGTVPTPVRVNATAVDANVSTQSAPLTISTGIPEQQGIAITPEVLNPPARGCVGDDIEVMFSARDRFSNPVVDGTPVNFSTEGGRVQSSCEIVDGSCTVTYTNQDPQPFRSTILAYLPGEESFKDRTGDGLFGPEEASFGPTEGDFDFNDPDSDADIGWIDSGEPFRDDNESGEFEPGVDGFFWDYYQTGEWTGPNGLYDGALCGAGIEDEAAREEFQDAYCGSPNAPIGVQTVMVISSNGPARIEAPERHTVGSGLLVVGISDTNGQTPPFGTQVSLDLEYGEVLGDDTVEIGSTNAQAPLEIAFDITEAGEDDTSECEISQLSVETPSGSCGGGAVVTIEIEICGSDS